MREGFTKKSLENSDLLPNLHWPPLILNKSLDIKDLITEKCFKTSEQEQELSQIKSEREELEDDSSYRDDNIVNLKSEKSALEQENSDLKVAIQSLLKKVREDDNKEEIESKNEKIENGKTYQSFIWKRLSYSWTGTFFSTKWIISLDSFWSHEDENAWDDGK